MTDVASQIMGLRRARPRNRFVRVSVLLIALLIAGAWVVGPRDPERGFADGAVMRGFQLQDTFNQRRLTNLQNFLQRIRPYPMRESSWSWSEAASWSVDLLRDGGGEAMVNTLATAAAAIVLAGLAGLMLCWPAARNFACAQPFSHDVSQVRPSQRRFWSLLVVVTRAFLILTRSIPEYIWAFLLWTLLGRSLWAAVLALALHNAGILGKLGAETVENVDPSTPRALRALGASRGQLAAIGLFPPLTSRLLLYFFYRWETCVREATVLGLLGFATLGKLIDDRRVSEGYDDELVFFVLLGAVLVWVGDLLSALARGYLRRSA